VNDSIAAGGALHTGFWVTHPTVKCCPKHPCKRCICGNGGRKNLWKPQKPGAGRIKHHADEPNTNAGNEFTPRKQRPLTQNAKRCVRVEGHSQTDAGPNVPSKTPAPMGTLNNNSTIGMHNVHAHSPRNRFSEDAGHLRTRMIRSRANGPNVDVAIPGGVGASGMNPGFECSQTTTGLRHPRRMHRQRLGTNDSDNPNDVARKRTTSSPTGLSSSPDRSPSLPVWTQRAGPDRRAFGWTATGAGGALLARSPPSQTPTQPHQRPTQHAIATNNARITSRDEPPNSGRQFRTKLVP